jgi:hypothetical protein
MFLRLLVCLGLIDYVVSNSHPSVEENTNFQLFAGQFGAKTSSYEVMGLTKFASPWSIWGETKLRGRIFFSDPQMHMIMVVTPDGIINRFAGLPFTPAFTSVGVLSPSYVTSAAGLKLNRPHGIYGDSDGQRLWVCDTLNNNVREIDISTDPYPHKVIGNKLYFLIFLLFFPIVSYFSLAGAPPVSFGAHLWEQFEGLTAVKTVLHAPIAIYWDKQTRNTFIAEVHKCRIRMINSIGDMFTIAGATGVCGINADGPALNSKLWKPFALSMDSVGRLLVADFGNNRIVQITIGGNMVTIGGGGSSSLEAEGDGGPAVDAYIPTPSGIWVDKYDNIWITESHGHRVRQIKAADGKIYHMIGEVGVKGTESSLWYPRGIWGEDLYECKIFIPDSLNRRIVSVSVPSQSPTSQPSSSPTYVVLGDLTVTTFAGNGQIVPIADGLAATSSSVVLPYGEA